MVYWGVYSGSDIVVAGVMGNTIDEKMSPDKKSTVADLVNDVALFAPNPSFIRG